MKTPLVLLVTTLALFAGLPLHADEVTFQQGVNGYYGVVDASIDSGKPDTPHGSSKVLMASAANENGVVRQFLIRFDDIVGTAPGQIPPGSTVQNATLRLTRDQIGGYTNSGWLVELLNPWKENVKWADFGGEGIKADDQLAGSTPLTKTLTLSSQLTAASVDVTRSVQKYVDGAPNHGWAVLVKESGQGMFAVSSNAEDPEASPVLEVSFTPKRD